MSFFGSRSRIDRRLLNGVKTDQLSFQGILLDLVVFLYCILVLFQHILLLRYDLGLLALL
ncbi:hypothetical protein ALP75_201050 [Pseudomonas syringae pv. actinidiae]|nr:hypothetical protein ALP75_201050 [Pseudomonas syringae pv. actinidiae]